MIAETWSTFHTPYTEIKVHRYAPTSAGVYSLWVKYDGEWGCFYVGKASNLESHLLDHLKPEEPNTCIKENLKFTCGFRSIEISTEGERSGAEKYLYDHLEFECNQDDPGGKPLKIPLPPSP